jgi:hypothetical protein
MTNLVLYCIGVTLASSLVSWTLAYVFARSRWPYLFVSSMLIVWAGLATFPTGHSWEPATYPADLEHLVAGLMLWSPFFVAALLALTWSVARGACGKTLLALSVTAAVVATPLSLLTALYAACSLGDCI